jgi:hypothetical protein
MKLAQSTVRQQHALAARHLDLMIWSSSWVRVCLQVQHMQKQQHSS